MFILPLLRDEQPADVYARTAAREDYARRNAARRAALASGAIACPCPWPAECDHPRH